MLDLIVSLIPIILLIFLMLKKNGWESYLALSVVAIITFLIKLFYFNSDFNLLLAATIDGFLSAWTPILIIAGAVFLFKTIKKTGDLKLITDFLNSISSNKVAQLMIIGWAFVFLLEGASGFGTPVAIAAPLLVALGFTPLKAIIFTLLMDTVPVSFGAVGTPIWFGFGQLDLSQAQILEIGIKNALINSVVALFLPFFALTLIIDKKLILKNWLFVVLSILSCIIPYFGLSFVSFEFPTIIGGLVGLLLTVVLARYGVGLDSKSEKIKNKINLKRLVKASFGLWGVAFLLIITRLEFLGIKNLLTSTSNLFQIKLEQIGTLQVSQSLVVSVNNILGENVNWSFAILYVPFLIPFLVISILVLVINKKMNYVFEISKEVVMQLKKATVALISALIFVKLILVGGQNSIAAIIGINLAGLIGGYWPFFASYLGGLGAFFSGSNAISNLTFGGIQLQIARSLNLNETTILAAQSVGGAMGNMICLNNIVAACSVLGVNKLEAQVLKANLLPFFIYGLISAVVVLFL